MRNTLRLSVGLVAAILVIAPGPAFALCRVTNGGGSTVVNCILSVLTDNTTNTDAASDPSVDRNQTFVTLTDPITATIQSGVNVIGYGLAVTTANATSIGFTNNGAVALGFNPGAAALNLSSGGGAITYSGNGSIDTGAQTVNALRASTTGTGTIGITTGGAISGLAVGISTAAANGQTTITTSGNITTGGRGIEAESSGAGAITVNVNAGTISTGASRRVSARSTGGGNVTVNVLSGATLLGDSNPFGIEALTSGGSGTGNVEVNFAGSLQSNISTSASGNGTATVNITGGSINSGAGLGAAIVDTANNAATINMSGGTILATGGSEAGLYALVSATGAAVVNMTGGQIGTSATQALTGVYASSVSGNVGVTAGTIFSDGTGVVAEITNASSTGTIGVTTVAGTTITKTGGAASGIRITQAGRGAVTAVLNGEISSSFIGLQANVTNGANASAVGITVNAAVNSTQTGISVAGLSSLAAVTVNANANITSTSATGINAASQGTVTVNVAAGVTVAGTSGVMMSGSSTVLNNSGSIVAAGVAVGTGSSSLSGLVIMNGPGASVTGAVFGQSVNDTIRFAGTGSNTFNLAQLQTFEQIRKQDAGTWTLTGTLFSGTPATTVSDGTLLVNGTLPSVATVTSGTLGGNGTIGGLIATGGNVAPGNSIDTLNVAGNVSFTGAAYVVEVNAAGLTDLLAATGTATLTTASPVQVLPEAGAYAPLTNYTILTAAGGVTGQFSGATIASPFFSATLSYLPQSVVLALSRVPIASLGQTPNQSATGGAYDALGGGAPHFAQFMALTGNIPGALDALSGDGYAALKGALIADARFIRDAALNAASGGTTSVAPSAYVAGASLPAPAAPKGLWGTGYGGLATTGSDGNAPFIRHGGGGFILGADAPVGDWTVGLLGGLGRTAYASPDRAMTAASTDGSFGLYAGGTWNATYLDLGAAITGHQIATNRAVVFPGVNQTLTASYGAMTSQVFAEAGHEVDLGASSLTPFGGIAYVAQGTAAFTETGGAAALSSAATSSGAVLTTLGLGGEHAINAGDGRLVTLRAKAAWRHAFGATPFANNSFAGGGPFTVLATPLAADALALSAGASIDLSATATLSIDYSGELAPGSQAHTASATLSGTF